MASTDLFEARHCECMVKNILGDECLKHLIDNTYSALFLFFVFVNLVQRFPHVKVLVLRALKGWISESLQVEYALGWALVTRWETIKM